MTYPVLGQPSVDQRWMHFQSRISNPPNDFLPMVGCDAKLSASELNGASVPCEMPLLITDVTGTVCKKALGSPCRYEILVCSQHAFFPRNRRRCHGSRAASMLWNYPCRCADLYSLCRIRFIKSGDTWQDFIVCKSVNGLLQCSFHISSHKNTVPAYGLWSPSLYHSELL